MSVSWRFAPCLALPPVVAVRASVEEPVVLRVIQSLLPRKCVDHHQIRARVFARAGLMSVKESSIEDAYVLQQPQVDAGIASGGIEVSRHGLLNELQADQVAGRSEPDDERFDKAVTCLLPARVWLGPADVKGAPGGFAPKP